MEGRLVVDLDFAFNAEKIEFKRKKSSRKIESLANAAKKSKSKNCLKNILFVQNFYHFKKHKNCEEKYKKKLQNKKFRKEIF